MKNIPDHLHIGCGLKAPAGWLNVDGSWQVVLARHPWIKKILMSLRLIDLKQADIPWSADVLRLNLANPLPFPDCSFVAVYSSHTLEHLYHDDALSLMKECYRVLRKGGVCRFVVPDLESMVTNYQRAKEKADPSGASRLMEQMAFYDKRRRRGPIGIYYLLTSFHQHKWLYDADSLRELFLLTGFHDVRVALCLDSRILRIGEVEDPGRILDGEGIVIEGVKE